MAKKNPFEAFEGMYSALSRFESTLSRFNTENYFRLVDNLSKVSTTSVAIEEAVQRQIRMFESLDTRIYEQPKMLEAMTKQWDVLARISDTFKTPEIDKLEKALLRNEVTALQIFTDSLSAMKCIEAPNLALLRMADIFEGVKLPKGMATVLGDMHVGTAKILSNSESVSYDTDSRLFYVEQSPQDTANISETNILCSSMQLLSGIDEADLISFLNCLEKHPPFASTHVAGNRINEIIAGWDMTMDFDHDTYYHARILPEGHCPYTENELRQAPYGVTWHGRFNYVGQSHYYFSDVQKGALLEVAKHSKEKQVQIATLKPSRKIKMIDLSGELTTQNKFLEYCRFNPSLDQYPNIKREYLLPCYVANCCEMHGIEGIKYYGSKEYKNYVSWNDSYFKFIGSEIQHLK